MVPMFIDDLSVPKVESSWLYTISPRNIEAPDSGRKPLETGGKRKLMFCLLLRPCTGEVWSYKV
jgi:hypothetical protein